MSYSLRRVTAFGFALGTLQASDSEAGAPTLCAAGHRCAAIALWNMDFLDGRQAHFTDGFEAALPRN
jgi:hypothetical protein